MKLIHLVVLGGWVLAAVTIASGDTGTAFTCFAVVFIVTAIVAVIDPMPYIGQHNQRDDPFRNAFDSDDPASMFCDPSRDDEHNSYHWDYWHYWHQFDSEDPRDPTSIHYRPDLHLHCGWDPRDPSDPASLHYHPRLYDAHDVTGFGTSWDDVTGFGTGSDDCFEFGIGMNDYFDSGSSWDD